MITSSFFSSQTRLSARQNITPKAAHKKLNAKALAIDLARAISGEVRFDDGSRALYATDASNYHQPPIGVVIPKTADDVAKAVMICQRHGAPMVHRGGGTSLTGSATNAAIVFDHSKYFNRILEINLDERWARVEPGCVLDTLRDLATPHGLTFGPDPATHNRCTLGGMIGNNSCGMHAQMAGRVADNVHELVVLTYDGLRLKVGATDKAQLQSIIHAGGRKGEIYARLAALRDRYADLIRQGYPKIPRRVSGYNLDELLPENGFHVARALVGSEGTCVTILEAKLRLVYDPQYRTLVTFGFKDIYEAADNVVEILPFGPIGLEGLDEKLVTYVRQAGGDRAKTLNLLPDGRAFLMIEFGGETKEEADAKANRLIAAALQQGLTPSHIKLYDDPLKEREIWQVRESGLGATAFVKGKADTWPGWEDAGVPPEKLGAYLRDFRQLLDRYGLDCSLYGHFGQGCIHCRIDFDLYTKQGVKNYRAFVEDAADLVVSYGGSLSAEHGDGQSRGELLPKMYGSELMEAMREFKRIWDPGNLMNPGKVVDAYPIIENLKLGPNYRPAKPKTYFSYPEDNGIAHATLRCVGVGLCRRESGGYMCPSYRVTKEEKHTTRGRAHLLFEMLQGNVIKDGWKDEHVKEALDLCLACKGCKGDCPVQVDLATLKAEFLAHYYQGRLRPKSAYTMGLIYWWARLASHVPSIANLAMQVPGIAALIKYAAGIAPQRQMPTFASETFRHWFEARPIHNSAKTPVMLWPDTFNNYFHPEVAKAAVDVLEDAGYRVIIPEKPLCCGRPLYDYGFLDLARHLLEHNLDVLKEAVAEKIPIIGLEPSCLAVFRDEMTNLLPQNQEAQKLQQQTLLLSEFLIKHVPNYRIPELKRKAIVQFHCHQSAVLGITDEVKLLKKMGLDLEILDAGCCGMAGSFGFEADKYETSIKIGEQELLPKIRRAVPETLILADGFSCQNQIAQGSGRRAIHMAQALQMAIKADARLTSPQRVEPMPPPSNSRNKPSWATLGLAGATGVILIGTGMLFYHRMNATRKSQSH